MVWYTHNGERLGTYNGHNGAIWTVHPDESTYRLVSGSADTKAKTWDVETGQEVGSWLHSTPVRQVEFALGSRTFLAVTGAVLGYKPTLKIWDAYNTRERVVMDVQGRDDVAIVCATWGQLNNTILTGCEDGAVRIYDVRQQRMSHCITDHTKGIMSISWDKYRGLFLTTSKDGYARLYDAKSLKNIKTYYTGRPINSGSISPIKEEVILGGGQPADLVTTTRVDNTQFRVKFFSLIFEHEIGSVQGHFGPVNVVGFSPTGKNFSSGGEDGLIRLHHFDKSYYDWDPTIEQ